MNYFRRWNCEVCGEPEQSVDTPKVKVCDRCSGEQQARADMQMYEFERQLRKAYERGYRHGIKRANVSYKQLAQEAADLLGRNAPGAAAMFDQAAEEGLSV